MRGPRWWRTERVQNADHLCAASVSLLFPVLLIYLWHNMFSICHTTARVTTGPEVQGGLLNRVTLQDWADILWYLGQNGWSRSTGQNSVTNSVLVW